MVDVNKVAAKKSLTIFHGPVNICGIGRYLSDWQRKQGMISDFITYDENPLMLNSQLCLHLSRYNFISRQVIKLLFFFTCLFKYKIFHFYFGHSFYKTNIDLPLLKLLGKKIIMTYCGSDIRLIKLERERNQYGHLLKIGINDEKYDTLKKMRMKWHKIWVNKVIAPRNLYIHAKEVFSENKIVKNIWIHNVLDLNEYESMACRESDTINIVHAPSNKLIKGTKYVDQAIDELKQRGFNFKYTCLANIDNEQVKNILKNEADIVLDQFLLGGFGTFAVEAMAFGKPVVCFLIESVRKEHYPDCPIVNANIDNLSETIASLLDDPILREKLGKQGRKFVERHFDSESVNKELLEIYYSL